MPILKPYNLNEAQAETPNYFFGFFPNLTLVNIVKPVSLETKQIPTSDQRYENRHCLSVEV
jgi:hypothetical protein